MLSDMFINKKKKAPVILRRDQHPISRNDIDPDALKVLYRLKNCGHTAYMVGGGVRDLLIGRKPKDFDVSTCAHPNQVKRLFRNCFLIGRRFRLAHIRFGDKIIETSTFRRRPDPLPKDAPAKHHAQDNTFGTPEEDAQRRDFTINGLFYDIKTFAVIDHVGGLPDLRKKVIRTIGNPSERFIEDPVRMVRAVRFAARLDFSIERNTLAAIKKHHSAAATAAPSRLLEEICRLFPYGSGSKAFKLLQTTGLLQTLFPEIHLLLKESRPLAATMYALLERLDQHKLPSTELHPGTIFAYLFCPVFRHELEKLPAMPHITEYLRIARSVLEPAAARYHLPKKYFYDILHQYALQGRIEAPRQSAAAKEKMLAQPFFADGLRLFYDYRKSRNLSTASLDELMALEPEQKPVEKTRRRRKRRRPRRNSKQSRNQTS